MKISAVVRALVAAGATPEMILAAVEAAEGEQEAAIDQRRASDAARQRRYRERRNVTSHDVTVTERDTPHSPPLPPAPPYTPPLSPQTTKSGARARASRLPAGWCIGDAEREAAASVGLPGNLIEAEAAKFRDYWHAKAGQQAAKLDWLATWRNWCRSAVERLPASSKPASLPATPDETKARWRRIWAEVDIDRDTPADPANKADWKHVLAYWFRTGRWPCGGPDPRSSQCAIPPHAVEAYQRKFGWIAPKIRAGPDDEEDEEQRRAANG